MSNKDIELQIEIEVKCPMCQQPIDHNYTEEDLMSEDSLLYTCKCGFSQELKSSELIDKAMKEAMKKLTEQFKG